MTDIISRLEAWLSLDGSKTLDSDLGIFIPNQGLDNSTVDKFTKENGVIINYNDGKAEIDTNENITNKTKHNNVPSCDLSGISL